MDRRLCAGLLLLAGMAGVAGCGQASPQTAAPAPPATEVVFDTPITQVVTDYEDFPGRTEAIYTVEVRSRVSGYLKRVYFHDGQEVRKDDLLFLIDPRPFQATLDRQKGVLEQADAHSKRLNNEYLRAKHLFEQQRSVSREEYDRYAFDHAEAEAALSTARANVDLAQLDLDWTKVTADLPEGIVGRLSRRMVDPGNLIKADDTMMTSIVSQDPLYVYFDVHEQAMLRIRRLIQEGKVQARSEKEVAVLIGLSDEKDREGNPVYPHQGMVDFTDNRVDLNTGTLRFRARLSNPDRMISPGLFVKVRLPIGEEHPALMIREQALITDQGEKKVIVLAPAMDKEKDGKPKFTEIKDSAGKTRSEQEYRPTAVKVETGVLRGPYREIRGGVKLGDMIVVQGMQKVRMGVKPNSKKEPDWPHGEPYTVLARKADPAENNPSPASGDRPAGPASAATAPLAPGPASATLGTAGSPSPAGSAPALVARPVDGGADAGTTPHAEGSRPPGGGSNSGRGPRGK